MPPADSAPPAPASPATGEEAPGVASGQAAAEPAGQPGGRRDADAQARLAARAAEEEASALGHAPVAPDATASYGDHPDQVIDFYRPRTTAGGARPAPLVVLLHGGAWRAAYDRAHVSPLAAHLAGAGYAVASVEYRRGPAPGAVTTGSAPAAGKEREPAAAPLGATGPGRDGAAATGTCGPGEDTAAATLGAAEPGTVPAAATQTATQGKDTAAETGQTRVTSAAGTGQAGAAQTTDAGAGQAGVASAAWVEQATPTTTAETGQTTDAGTGQARVTSAAGTASTADAGTGRTGQANAAQAGQTTDAGTGQARPTTTVETGQTTDAGAEQTTPTTTTQAEQATPARAAGTEQTEKTADVADAAPPPAGRWPETFDDVAAATDAVAGLAVASLGAKTVDPRRIVLTGHSAGGHLALWAAARHVLPAGSPWRLDAAPALRGVVALAPIADFGAALRLQVCSGAVSDLLGAPDHRADRLPHADPSVLLPTGIATAIVHGTTDTVVPPQVSEAFIRAATAAGEEPTVAWLPGTGHFPLIDPAAQAVAAVVDEIAQLAW